MSLFKSGDGQPSEKEVTDFVNGVANKAMSENFSAMLKSAVNGGDGKELIEQIVKSAFASSTFKDEVSGEQMTIAAAIKAVQEQHDALVLKVQEKTKGMEDAKKGAFVAHVEKLVSEKGYERSNYSSGFTMKAAELMSTLSVIGAPAAGGFSPLFGNFIDTEIGHRPKPDNVLLTLISVKSQPGTESIWYTDRINEEGDAQFIAEGTLKPMISAEYKTSKEDVKEVAEHWKFTKRLMNHAPSIMSDFLDHAQELVDQKIDTQALIGDGVGPNLAGIATKAGAFVPVAGLTATVQNANIYDAIVAGATAVNLANFNGEITCLVNTVWRARMKHLKDKNDNYIIPPFATLDGKSVDGVRVVFNNKVPAGKILIGELRRFNLVFAEHTQYDEGYVDQDFTKNLVTRKLEAFLGTYMKNSDAGSIIYDDIATILTSINKP